VKYDFRRCGIGDFIGKPAGLDLARLRQKPPYLCGVFIDIVAFLSSITFTL
jgi:hypothetical protein